MTVALSLQAKAAMLINSNWADIPFAAESAASIKRRSVTQMANLSSDLGAPASRLNMPPPAQSSVSRQEASEALSRILANVKPAPDRPAPIGLKELEKVPMDSILLASTLLTGEILGSTALAKSKALSIMTDKQERIREQEIRDCREEMDKAVADQNKARKAGIFSVVFDWIIAAVELVSGLAKLVGGVLTGNFSTIAGGAMDVLAGLAGVVKATFNTMALIDPDNAEKLKEFADVAGQVQMYMEIAGALVDITSAARNLVVAKIIPKVTGTLLKNGAGATIVQSVKRGSTGALNKIAEQVGQQVASQASAKIAQKLAKTALNASTEAVKVTTTAYWKQFGVNNMLKQFSETAIKEMVTKAVTAVGQQAIKKGTQLTVKEVTKAVNKAVWSEVIPAVFKASAYVGVQAARGVVGGVSQIASGITEHDRARLQKDISQLILDQQWLQTLFALYKSEKEAALKRMADLMEGQGQVMEDGSKAITHAGAVQVQIAAAMV